MTLIRQKSIYIALPSYNERENISNLIKSIQKLNLQTIICVVDDNSPDKTSEKIETEFKKDLNKKLYLIKRDKKDGRGGAVLEGFRFSKNIKKFDIYIEMDCDFSHSIEDLQTGIKLFSENNFDCLLGSRYPDGVIINWPLSRRIFSFFSNVLIRFLISSKIKDYTNGFRFYNEDAIDIMLNHKPINKGYILLSEILTLFLKKRLSISEFPIRFVNRERGVSNTSLKEIFSSLIGIFKIYFKVK